jgi:hypothetical protein
MPSKKRTPLPGSKGKLDDKLDQALEDTFPASDPVAITEPSPEDQADDPRGKNRKSGTKPGR